MRKNWWASLRRFVAGGRARHARDTKRACACHPPGGSVRCRGKGRKERSTPLRKDVVVALRGWLRERLGNPADPLFPSARGGPLSRDGAERIMAKHVANAEKQCPSLAKKRISMHALRHS